MERFSNRHTLVSILYGYTVSFRIGIDKRHVTVYAWV